MSYVIETKNLSKKYPELKRYRDVFLHPFKKKYFTALHDVTIQVKKGEIFGLLGLGTILGAIYTAAGIGGLLGPTLAGWLIDKSGGYSTAISVAMLFALSGFLLLIPVGHYLKGRE